MPLEGKSPEEISALAQMTDAILGNPKTRLRYQRLLKEAVPGVSIPELETADGVQAAVAGVHERLNKREEIDAADRAQQAANALFERLRDDGLCQNRPQFGELVKYANEKGYRTDETGLRLAAQSREAELEAAEPTPMTAGLASVLQRDNKPLMKDPIGWARQTAADAIEHLRKAAKNGGRLPQQ